MRRNEERTDKAHAHEKRAPVGLPLRAQEEPSQPPGRNARQHGTLSSKPRAEAEHGERRVGFSA